MNEIFALLQLFENKVASLWQLDGEMRNCDIDDRFYTMETRQRRLQSEVDDLRNKLTALLTERLNEA